MSLENSIEQLTLSINKLISTLEKSNEVKTDSEYILEDKLAPTPTVKPVEKVVEQPAITPLGVALNILEMRDNIRTICSELVQRDKANKVGIEDIFSKFKATHLRMVSDETVPKLYAKLLLFKG